jgi:predicted regulator of Ras-like GTPase activity (Roadblock/LC7/MglB family)
VWLIAKALGERRPTPKRLAALATLEGLRAAILMNTYGLTIRGAVTPARLRQALAAVALRKAFGGATAAAVAGKSGLPARASRLLAAQLLDKPRDPGTDRRLVSALAQQACGARDPDLAALRAAVLRRFFAAPPQASAAAVPAGGALDRSVSNLAPAQTRPATPAALQLPAAARSLDLVGFATEVRRLAAGEAQGWSGDRKAYISRVWRSLRERRPEWALSEIEFKCMLAEAHRSGQLNLANADLKDESNIKDVQDSAVIYRNAVFHFIRVDA